MPGLGAAPSFGGSVLRRTPKLQSVVSMDTALRATEDVGKGYDKLAGIAQNYFDTGRTDFLNKSIADATKAKGAPLSTTELVKLRSSVDGALSKEGEATYAQNVGIARDDMRDKESLRRFTAGETRANNAEKESLRRFKLGQAEKAAAKVRAETVAKRQNQEFEWRKTEHERKQKEIADNTTYLQGNARPDQINVDFNEKVKPYINNTTALTDAEFAYTSNPELASGITPEAKAAAIVRKAEAEKSLTEEQKAIAVAKKAQQDNISNVYNSLYDQGNLDENELQKAKRLYRENPDSPLAQQALTKSINASKVAAAKLSKLKNDLVQQELYMTAGYKANGTTGTKTASDKGTNKQGEKNIEKANEVVASFLKDNAKMPKAARDEAIKYANSLMAQGYTPQVIKLALRNGTGGAAEHWYDASPSAFKKVTPTTKPISDYYTRGPATTTAKGNADAIALTKEKIAELERGTAEVKNDKIDRLLKKKLGVVKSVKEPEVGNTKEELAAKFKKEQEEKIKEEKNSKLKEEITAKQKSSPESVKAAKDKITEIVRTAPSKRPKQVAELIKLKNKLAEADNYIRESKKNIKRYPGSAESIKEGVKQSKALRNSLIAEIEAL